jgi:hypothetical protein
VQISKLDFCGFQRKEANDEKVKLQKELQRLLTTEIYHGPGPDRLLYRGLLFKRPLGGANKQRYTCHVCKITVLDKDVVNHAKGKKHASNMEDVKIIDYKKEQGDDIKEKNETGLIKILCDVMNYHYSFYRSQAASCHSRPTSSTRL